MLKPQSQDRLVRLDLDILLDVMEAAGLAIPDEHALRCLRDIPQNQLGRHNLNDIVVWVRRYLANPPPVNPPFWRNLAYSYRKFWTDKRDQGVKLFKGIVRQNEVMNEIKKLEEHRAKATAVKVKRQVLSKRASSLAANKEQFSSGSKMKGSQRLSLWQKRRQTEHPCSVAFIGPFGKIEKKEKTEAEKQKEKKKLTSLKKQVKEEVPDWKSNIRFEFFTKPDIVKRSELVSSNGTLKDIESVTPLDYMDYFDSFGYKVELTEAEVAAAVAAAAAAK